MVPPGYLVNNLVWCGKSGGGLDTDYCPSYGSCGHETSVSFWRATSIHYASLARGTAYLMLNGTRGTAFTDTSVFAQYELPNIDASRVTTVHAYVIHDIGGVPRESCRDTNTSIAKLKRLVLAKGLDFECTDDPISVRLLQCVDQPGHSECRSISSTGVTNHAPPRRTRVAAVLPTLTALLIPLLAASL